MQIYAIQLFKLKNIYIYIQEAEYNWILIMSDKKIRFKSVKEFLGID